MKRLLLLLIIAPLAYADAQPTRLMTGADQIDLLLPKLAGKRVAMLVNHTAVVGKRHLVDTLLAAGIKIVKIMAPEHGFRGALGFGEEYNKDAELASGIPIINMYNPKDASPEMLNDVDVVVFDVQDVGVRCYTYTRNLHYQMESCALAGKKLIILDRPNPNGSYIDGPVLNPEQFSHVGMHPVPIVHGMTLGEFAQMINGEGWLRDGKTCQLEVIKVRNWKHADAYHVGIRPSPNLPNDNAIGWYPSISLFEGTEISVGRGTTNPFEFIGHPSLKNYSFHFTPVNMPGIALNPPQMDNQCYGIDLRNAEPPGRVSLAILIELYQAFPVKNEFFKTTLFDRLVGSSAVREQIQRGMSEQEIRATWKPGVDWFKVIRAKYLLYP